MKVVDEEINYLVKLREERLLEKSESVVKIAKVDVCVSKAKLLNSIITLNGQAMNLGSSYTTPLLAISNGMLAGSIALSKLASGTIGQIIIVNALGNAIYGSLSLKYFPIWIP